MARTKAEQETCLQEAQRLVHGARGADYGHPFHDFSRAGRIWAVMLEEWKKTPPGTPVPPSVVGMCQIGTKMSREANRPKRDNRTDIAGYAETVQMVEDYLAAEADLAERRKRRQRWIRLAYTHPMDPEAVIAVQESRKERGPFRPVRRKR